MKIAEQSKIREFNQCEQYITVIIYAKIASGMFIKLRSV